MEVRGYRQNLEMIVQRFPNRLTVSPKEVADAFGINQKTVYQACKKRRDPLPCVRFSQRKILIPVSELAIWLSERSLA